MQNIGIALAGGGLQGISHIGVIRALEELGIKIEYVSGTSTGSIIASLYAMGYNTYEMEEIIAKTYKKILKTNKKKILKIAVNFMLGKPTGVPGIIDGKIVENFINEFANKKNIKNITEINNKNLAIITVDTVRMEECIFLSKNIKQHDEKVINGFSIGSIKSFPNNFSLIFFCLSGSSIFISSFCKIKHKEKTIEQSS